METEKLKRLGAGRKLMKNNDSDWHLHYALQETDKYKNKDGIQLNLNDKDSFSLLLKEITLEAIKLIDANKKFEAKCFLMKNFDINQGELK
tara:strand:+ start:471 stop:743 length:273 start_codon:yes stop_codon:yes gene_type:complete